MKYAMNAAAELGVEGWVKPWSGTGGGNCVEFLELPDGSVAIRNSTNPEGPATIHSAAEIQAFIVGVKQGAADFLLPGS
jgi:hypothetical protein